jgi:hypothetical protein
MPQVTTSHSVRFDTVFDRPLDSVYKEGGIDCYRMCEWGIMKRAVEAGLRSRKIVALGRLHVEVRHRGGPRVEDPRARDGSRTGRSGDAQQRLGVHHAQDDGGLPHARARQAGQRGLDAQEWKP